MNKLLRIGEFLSKEIRARIEGITAFAPLYADFNTSKPFIAYQRDDLRLHRDKDGLDEQAITITLFIVSDSYAQGVDILGQTIDAVLGHQGEYYIDIINSTEFADGDSFVQSLTLLISE